jgi:thiamine biosynthesis lipoprotein
VDQRFLEQPEQRYPHILDPLTGQPVQGVSSVTVIAGHGYFADAAATALVVAGRESWEEVAEAFELDAVLLIDDQGNLLMTPEMKNRLILEPD